MNCCQSSPCIQQGSLSHRACPHLREETKHAVDEHPYNGHTMVSKSRWILMLIAWVRRGCSHNSINPVCVQEASSCAPVDDTKKQVCTLLPQRHVATSTKVSYLFTITLKFRTMFRAELFPQYLTSLCYPLFLLFQGAACCSSCLSAELPTPLAYFCVRQMEQPQEPPGCKLHYYTKANTENPGQNQHCKNYCQETTFRSCKLGKKKEKV